MGVGESDTEIREKIYYARLAKGGSGNTLLYNRRNDAASTKVYNVGLIRGNPLELKEGEIRRVSLADRLESKV